MTGTTDLRSEHAGVSRMLAIMDRMAGSARMGERPDHDDLAEVIEFLRVFVDQCHHTKEERLLFPAIRAANMTSTEQTIVTLLADHARGRDAVSRMAEAAQRLAKGDESANTDLAEVMTGYTRLLRAHIRREESGCFDAADRELSEDVQGGLAEGYERIEHEVVGEGVHEGFHAMLDRLAATYHV